MGSTVQQTMVPDNWNFNGRYPCLYHGGNYNQNQNHGPFYINYNNASNTNDNIRDRNRVISFKRASGLISRLGQLRKCNHQQVLDRYYQPKTMFALKKVVRKECRRLQALYPPYQAA